MEVVLEAESSSWLQSDQMERLSWTTPSNDALEAGFDKVVFVIRKDLEKDFKEIIGNRIEKEVEVAYAFQELDDISEKFSGKFTGRTKPWGTGQAILCCKDVVDAPSL